MKHLKSQRFPALHIVELFDYEQNRDSKYELLQLLCEWHDPLEKSVAFYMTEENWETLSRNKNMCLWLLENAQ